ncbi:hypothetical protein QKU48_gp1203 [Fadolivirus algeromassiliense]|uniref:Uncharacterized protein n=1 Tax=Fadolivirus FV1/VV64 TaxID=3070911 RepID=A0A7D3R1X6_9VIRU|nr:hypothetical protein QKU48_gp1203 [Fadolivirus algeromassiliense]QKF94661.1 hypothetical protein Fadolivirus_1_1203 [Fadolivirus FV1/VV64]
MELLGTTITYKVSLNIQIPNMLDFYTSLSLNDILKCVQYENHHKCNYDNHKNKSETKVKSLFFNCVYFILKHKSITVYGKLFKNGSLVIVAKIKDSTIDFDEMTHFIINELKINSTYTKSKVINYSEFWNISKINNTKIEANVLTTKIDNQYDLSEIFIGTKLTSLFSDIILTKGSLMFRLKDFNVYESEKKKFINFIKKVFDYDLIYDNDTIIDDCLDTSIDNDDLKIFIEI